MPKENAISLPEWLRVIEKEYLQDYVSGGGAAVKFVIPLAAAGVGKVRQGLAEASARQGFQFAAVDAAVTKVHLVEQVFFAVARQLDWDQLTRQFLFGLLKDRCKLPENQADVSLAHLAALNGCAEKELRLELRNVLRTGLARDYAMAQEFRSAIGALIRHMLDPVATNSGMDEIVKSWLRGELKYIRPMKDLGIFQRINRSNARYLLHSLSHWLKRAGHSGLIVFMDITRYLEEGPRNDGGLVYRKTAVLDCYEVLRQFIDGVDESENCLVVVAAPLTFVQEDERRNVDAYQALKLRIWDEVRDRRKVNPLAPMVRVETEADPLDSCPPQAEEILR